MDLVWPIATRLKKPENPLNRFIAKMAAKTTSGSGFYIRFAFYALDVVENEYNIEGYAQKSVKRPLAAEPEVEIWRQPDISTQRSRLPIRFPIHYGVYL